MTDPFDLEIWLVHRRPDKSEGVQRVAMQGLPGGAAFEFPLVPAGGLNVDVRGRFTVVDTPAGQRELSLRFDRAVIGQQTWRSTGTRAIAMPSPDDVVSFELPPPFGTERAALDGHLFSLRIRIRPAK